MNKEAEVNLNVLPVFCALEFFGLVATGLVQFRLRAHGTSVKFVRSWEWGNSVRCLVKVGNTAGEGVSEAHVPEVSLLLDREGTNGQRLIGGVLKWQKAGVHGAR